MLTPAETGTLTHCPDCAFQCGMTLVRANEEISVAARPDFPVNRGALCVKGWTAAETLEHPDRLRTPLVRDTGALRPAGWVGGLGAFGGFAIPPLLGIMVHMQGAAGYAQGFVIFSGLAAFSLVLAYRIAAPRRSPSSQFS